ncbi:DsbA family oxidoreductase [uncultured Lactobacillus sp.]|uniref:DsbA family oxidoreductase n=1 Tax=uncultured Lactobacillus sp. TaxID=153152 RepID=UPI0026018325|nr:DsbA family oxidoreductase [uncultured Lactobacillus sp.]
MEIIIWLDYACPYCYVDFTRLQKVIKSLSLDKKIYLNIHAAQIDPSAPKKASKTTGELLAAKDGLTKKEVLQRFEGIKELGQRAGLDIRYQDTKNTDTMDAHRLVQWVLHELKDEDRAVQLANLLFKTYFSENKELADHEVLIDRAYQVGINKDKAHKMLDSDEYRDLVIEQEDILEDRDIDSVPYMLIDNRAYSGIQDEDVLKQAINAAFYASAK